MADLSIMREPLSERFTSEAEDLYNDYYKRTKAGEDVPPLDFLWERYYAIEQMGNYVLFTARRKGKLVGIAMYFLSEHLHHRGWKVAYCDGLSVHLDERGQGVGAKLVAHAEVELAKLGAQRMIHGERSYNDKTSLFEKIGFRLSEKIYVKDLTLEDAEEGDAETSTSPAGNPSPRIADLPSPMGPRFSSRQG